VGSQLHEPPGPKKPGDEKGKWDMSMPGCDIGEPLEAWEVSEQSWNDGIFFQLHGKFGAKPSMPEKTGPKGLRKY
jgi:hypothetical protein